MKKIIVLLVILLLSGCQYIEQNKDLDDVFSVDNIQTTSPNNYTDYIEYYLPSDVIEDDSDELNFVFDISGSKFIMNINVPGIINAKYYPSLGLLNDGFFDESNLYYENSGTYINKDKEDEKYDFKVYKYEDDYILLLTTRQVLSYGYCDKTRVSLLADKMYQVVKGTSVNEQLIIANYSSKDVIDYQKNTVNLFGEHFPVNGRIDDLLIGENSQVSDE